MPRMFVSELILFVSENGADVDESNAKKMASAVISQKTDTPKEHGCYAYLEYWLCSQPV